VIETSNTSLQQAKLEGTKLLGWRERQLQTIMIGNPSREDVLKLFNPSSTFWSRYGFWILFNRLTSSPDFFPLASIGSYNHYIKDFSSS